MCVRLCANSTNRWWVPREFLGVCVCVCSCGYRILYHMYRREHQFERLVEQEHTRTALRVAAGFVGWIRIRIQLLLLLFNSVCAQQ